MRAVMFSGQGAQVVGMGAKLYDVSAEVRELYEEANQILGWDIKAVSFFGPTAALKETRICQPALFLHSYAVYRVLKDQGRLDRLIACLGLSLGELTALAVAGAFSFRIGLQLVAERARLMQAACDAIPGTMVCVVGGEPKTIESFCRRNEIDVANYNAPGQIVISGAKEKLERTLAGAEAELGCSRLVTLNVAGAYHSRLMEPARTAYATYLKEFEIHYPELPVFSNVTGKLVFDPDEIRNALAAQIVSAVRWSDCLLHAAELGADTFVECGPGKVLVGLAKRTNASWATETYSDEEISGFVQTLSPRDVSA